MSEVVPEKHGGAVAFFSKILLASLEAEKFAQRFGNLVRKR